MANPPTVQDLKSGVQHTVTISDVNIASYLSRGDIDTSLEHLLELGISRWSPVALKLKAMMHMRRGRWGDAENLARQLLAVHKKDAGLYKLLGDANFLQNKYLESEMFYARSVLLDATPEAIHDLGVAIVSQGRVEESIEHFKQACEVRPESEEFKHHLAIMMVLAGHLEEGWEMMKHRMGYQGITSTFPNPEKYWEGQDLTGKTIVVRSEQGWGDTIMFARYLPKLLTMAKKVYFWCQRPMVPFVKFYFPEVIAWPTDVPPPLDFDYHVNLMCFPRRFPGEYMAPKKQDFETTKDVGICWFGSPTHKADHLRSVPVERFSRIAEIAGGKLKCLAYGRFDQKPDFMEYFIDDCWDFKDTAERIKSLNLIITVDTAIAHLCGFLGKECWLLLPYVPDFRWGIEQTQTTPWYESLKLYRQPRLFDWDSVFMKVEDDLRARL